MTTLTPLEPWIRSKTGLPATEPLTRPLLEEYQFGRLIQTIEHARRSSPFYRQHLEGCGEPASLADLARVPFTFPAELQADDLRFLCAVPAPRRRPNGSTLPEKI
jgi:phenylacetate-coenzyme A ligase PaaK-like adenylate-forming protein